MSQRFSLHGLCLRLSPVAIGECRGVCGRAILRAGGRGGRCDRAIQSLFVQADRNWRELEYDYLSSVSCDSGDDIHEVVLIH